jgi:hypothetical protein
MRVDPSLCFFSIRDHPIYFKNKGVITTPFK